MAYPPPLLIPAVEWLEGGPQSVFFEEGIQQRPRLWTDKSVHWSPVCVAEHMGELCLVCNGAASVASMGGGGRGGGSFPGVSGHHHACARVWSDSGSLPGGAHVSQPRWLPAQRLLGRWQDVLGAGASPSSPRVRASSGPSPWPRE